MENNTFADLQAQLIEDVNSFNDVAVKTANSYTADLDELMNSLYNFITKPDEVETVIIERYYMELTNLLYFMSQKVETLNIYADIAKSKAKEAYNGYYLQFSSNKDEKGKSVRTVAENTALSEQNSKTEATLGMVYESAYSIAKNKVAAGFEMVNTIRKVLSVRQTQMQLDMGPSYNIKATSSEEV
uniref:Uncharacterized protein n=1 Tax=Siphoviridae sp. ctrpg19 TaxID=2826481 RepID=A0A8S5MKY9_9CAUD|nr:MAG TPA: hypothetical protein [Siphoviridae sp. ctrpg19]